LTCWQKMDQTVRRSRSLFLSLPWSIKQKQNHKQNSLPQFQASLPQYKTFSLPFNQAGKYLSSISSISSSSSSSSSSSISSSLSYYHVIIHYHGIFIELDNITLVKKYNSKLNVDSKPNLFTQTDLWSYNEISCATFDRRFQPKFFRYEIDTHMNCGDSSITQCEWIDEWFVQSLHYVESQSTEWMDGWIDQYIREC
jgi:hypothetical protein